MILLLPYDVLSSVTRQLELASAFRARGHEVRFAGDGPYVDLIAAAGFPVEALPNLRAERLLAHLRALREDLAGFGRVAAALWREIDLARYVDAEVALFERLRPSAVLSEERPTAQISCRLAGVPHVSLRNAYRTAHSALPMLEPRSSWMRALHPDPVAAQDLLVRILGAPFFARLRAIARSRGLAPRLRYDDYLEGDDLALLCDVPEFAPTRELGERYVVIGPLYWDPPWPDPPWIDELPAERSAIYVSLGSSGTPQLFHALAQALRGEGTPLVIATGRQLDAQAIASEPHVKIAELLRATRILERAALCVCHGGNGTVYQALSRGVPLVCVPTHLEQRFNARRVAELGLGMHLELADVLRDPGVLGRAVEAIRVDPRYAARALLWQRRIAELDAPGTAVAAVERLLASRGQRATRRREVAR